jgi:hypothetical protein
MGAATAAGVPAAAARVTPTAPVLGESAGREHDGTQQAAEQDFELIYWRTSLHKSPIVCVKNLLESGRTRKGPSHCFRPQEKPAVQRKRRRVRVQPFHL